MIGAKNWKRNLTENCIARRMDIEKTLGEFDTSHCNMYKVTTDAEHSVATLN
jgi:hypothetical protein